MTWPRFERFVLDSGPDDSVWRAGLMFWPWIIATLAFIVAEPARNWLIYHRFIR